MASVFILAVYGFMLCYIETGKVFTRRHGFEISGMCLPTSKPRGHEKRLRMEEHWVLSVAVQVGN